MPGVLKAAPAAPLARRQRRALPLSGPPGARRATRQQDSLIKVAHTSRYPGQHTAVFLGDPLSNSRPPRQWRPYGPSHAIGYADH
jgi:hypothetical protein